MQRLYISCREEESLTNGVLLRASGRVVGLERSSIVLLGATTPQKKMQILSYCK